jgi:hypothetical protein
LKKTAMSLEDLPSSVDTTWSLVRTKPPASMIEPVPVLLVLPAIRAYTITTEGAARR